MQNESISNKDIYQQFKDKVTEYIHSVQDKGGFIYKLTDIREYVNTIPIIQDIPKPTFYRYIRRLRIRQMKHPYNGKNYYDFDSSPENSEETLLEFNLSFRKYNKILYITVASHLGYLLSEFLNCNLKNDIFYSTFNQGLLCCHYYYNKNSDDSNLGKAFLNSAYIKKEISRITKAILYNGEPVKSLSSKKC